MSVEIQGTWEPRFDALPELLAASIECGEDIGASVAVTVDGEVVADLWAGWVDEARTAEWAADTITNVWSTTKAVTVMCALLLVEAGDLDPDAPVSRYWPEFAAGGKDDKVLVRHLLGHTAGLPGWTVPITHADLYDWEKATSLLAAQEPWWEPGAASGYHAVTQGYLVGEVLRRITGRSVGHFLADELAGPLGADFHIGVDPSDLGRVADVTVVPTREVPAGWTPAEFAIPTFRNPPLDAAVTWTEEWRRAEIPAANGHGTARAVALLVAALANGGEVSGRKLFSPSTCERVLEQQSDGVDLVLGVPVRFGMGFALAAEEVSLGLSGRSCFWGGHGGSQVGVDFERRATFSYVMNKMGSGLVGDERGFNLSLAAFAAVD